MSKNAQISFVILGFALWIVAVFSSIAEVQHLHAAAEALKNNNYIEHHTIKDNLNAYFLLSMLSFILGIICLIIPLLDISRKMYLETTKYNQNE